MLISEARTDARIDTRPTGVIGDGGVGLIDRPESNGHELFGVGNDVSDTVSEAREQVIRLPDSVAPVPEVPRRDASKIYRAIGLGLIATDLLCITAALLIAYYTRFEVGYIPLDYLAVLVTAPLVWVAVFHGFSLHAQQHLSPTDEFRRVVGAVSVGMVLVIMGSFWSKSSFSRMWVGLTWILALGLELACRLLWRRFEGRLKARGRLTLRTLVIGTNDEARSLAESLAVAGSGYQPVGFVAPSTPYIVRQELPLAGSIDDLSEIIREEKPECLFVAMSDLRSDEVMRVAQISRTEGVQLRLSINLPEILSSRLSFHSVGSAMAMSIKPVRFSGNRALLKRIFDISIAATALLVTLPLWPIIAVAIKLSSPGPIFFRQERITKGGRGFTMYKFRTMVVDADRLMEEHSLDRTTPFFKVEVGFTKVGRFLRRFSLDELPQLINVLKGDMSVVGPRPLPAEQVAANLDLLSARHEVPAGVTGWWQINGRSDVDSQEAVRLDRFYIENWSLALDLYIMWRTVGVLFARKGAY